MLVAFANGPTFGGGLRSLPALNSATASSKFA